MRSVYVPCDLSVPGWEKELCGRGFDKRQKSFAGLLGLTYYLRPEDFRLLMAALSDLLNEGSAVCFDYPSVNGSSCTGTARALAAGAGEKMQAEYAYDEMEGLLSDSGFLICEHLDARDMTELCFKEYNARVPAHPMRAPEGVEYLLAVRK